MGLRPPGLNSRLVLEDAAAEAALPYILDRLIVDEVDEVTLALQLSVTGASSGRVMFIGGSKITGTGAPIRIRSEKLKQNC